MPSSPPNVRAARPSDANDIARLHQEAFDGPVEAAIAARLAETDRAALSFVAQARDDIVGHAVASPVTLEPAPVMPWRALGLGPVAVRPAWQGKRVGTRLCRTLLDRARADGWHAVVVLGDPAYYARFGFARASDAGLGNVYGVDDPFMVIAWSKPLPRGVVHYDEAFSIETDDP